MEEKERYEIHIYDDVCVDLYDNGVLDKSINDTYKLEELLNQQSKRIKELEQENQQLKQQLAEKDKEIEKYSNANIIVVGERSQGKKHLMQIKIKELQDQKAIEQLEKVKENAWQSATDISCLLDYTELAKIIDNQIKELKGENNE